MAEKNIPKLIAGIFLSLTLILSAMGLIVLMSYESVGVLFLLVPMSFLVRMVWVNKEDIFSARIRRYILDDCLWAK